MDKYYKNFILCGEANFYCILCQEGFQNKIQVEKHLRWEKHRKIIKQQEYVHKFRKENIYKITDGYFYCEICNVVNLNAVDHIKGSAHQEIKKSGKNKVRTSNVLRDEDGSIKIHNRVITTMQWHGIVYNTCFTCNEPVGRILTHMKCFNHMTKLIQSETLLKDNQLYRQVGANKFYCFLCFKVLESKSFETHWIDEHNRNDNSQETEISNSNNETNENLDTIELLKTMENKYFSFEIQNKATCLKCQEIIEATYDAVSQHKKSHQSSEAIIEKDLTRLRTDKGKGRAELAKYGRENFITLNEGGSKGYCSLCNICISAHMNIAKQHVEGAYHRGHLERKGLIKSQKHEEPNIISVPYQIFVDVSFGPFKIHSSSFVCINNGICIDILSYKLICDTGNLKKPMKCFACDLIIDLQNSKEHANTKEHTKILQGCKVLPMKRDDYDEFIREIHPSLYHCGYCNKTFSFWENLIKHLKSFPHTEKRQQLKCISYICAKLHVDPSCSLSDIEEYEQLKQFFG